MHLVSRILQPPKWLAGFRRANRTRRKGHLAIGRDLERLEERQLLSTIFMTPDHTAFLSAGSMATSLPGAFAETLGGTTNRSVSSGSMNVVLPAAPSFTATAVSASQINLTWTGVAGATSYFVDQWTGSAWTQVASLGSGSTSYAVNGLSPNTTYYFDVAASNAAGTTWANYQGATTRAATLTPPAAPAFTATAVSATQINLAWTGVAGATSYVVDRWTGSAWTQVAGLGSGSTSYAVNGLSPNTTYYFEVAASNAAGTTWANYQGATTFQNTVAVDHPAAATAYSPVSGSLFGASGPSYLDVRQGAVGDCWLMASLAEVAARDPSDIRNMFTDLGSTTESGSTVELYKVRFFNGAGVPEYVTVDTELPSGGDYYDQPVNGVLWVALAEKAYGEANGERIVTTQYVGSDSYAALNGGDPAWALQAITGKSASYIVINPANIAAAWNAGQLIVLGSSPNAGDNLIVGDSTGTHAYAVVGYVPSSSEPFELYNPWGLSSVLDHTMEFNGNRVYDGPFLCDSSLISQDFNSQFIGTGAAPGLDDHGNTMAPVIVAPEVAPPMPLVLTQVPDKARVALHQDLALDALQQHDFDLSWVA
ncbi:MAG: fibronectin type III domain-containing protein [Planctomycetaceae bacterium]|nr:fibronectin type III domain-containing protein [Planctomycetaceae bacterium]